MKKFFKEFKEFISRGNLLDMAVGVIIGGAFSAIVTAFTNHIIRPLIDWFIYIVNGGKGVAAYTFLVIIDEAGLKEGEVGFNPLLPDMEKSIYIDWGAFISAIINFLLVAFVLFMIIKAFNRVHNAANLARDVKAKKEKGLPLTKKEKKLLAQIEEQEALEAEKKAEEERLAAIEAAKPTREEELLMEIRDLLKK